MRGGVFQFAAQQLEFGVHAGALGST